MLGHCIYNETSKLLFWLIKLFGDLFYRNTNGIGVPEHDDIHAQIDLARCYDDGIGVPKDDVILLNSVWLARCYESECRKTHDIHTQIDLARCYDDGIGVPKDNVILLNSVWRDVMSEHLINENHSRTLHL